MSKPDPRAMSHMADAQACAPYADDVDAHANQEAEARWLLRLAGASTLAILALAAASVVMT